MDSLQPLIVVGDRGSTKQGCPYLSRLGAAAQANITYSVALGQLDLATKKPSHINKSGNTGP